MNVTQGPVDPVFVVGLAAAVLAYVLMLRVLVFASAERQTGAVWQAAERQAEAMLREVLSEPELRQLAQHGYLEVASRRFPQRTYRIPRHPGLVGVYERGLLVSRLCVGAVEAIPAGDSVLLHKLMIEGSEDDYLRLANSIKPPYPFFP